MQQSGIRFAQPADYPTIEAIENTADRPLIDWLGATLWPAATPAEVRAAHAGFLLVYEMDGAVVGFAHVLELDAVAHLEQLSVAPAHGRRGYGRHLLNAAVDEARYRGHRRITLRTYADVPWNAPFYRRCGFVEEQPSTEFDRHLVEVEERLGLTHCGRRVQLALDLS